MDVIMPQLGETVAEGVVTKWYKKVGDPVKADESLFDVETDKVSTEIPAQANGVVAEILVEAGTTVKVGTRLAVIAEGAPASGPRAQAPLATAEDPAGAQRVSPTAAHAAQIAKPPLAPRAAGAQDRLSPVVRKLLAQHSLDPAAILGSGRNGRITRDDVTAYLAQRPSTVTPPQTPSRVPQTPAERIEPTADVTAGTGALPPPAPRSSGQALPLNSVRKRVAENVQKSWTTVPHVLQVVEADFHRIEQARREAGTAWKEREGFSLTYLPFIVRALSIALGRYPKLNGSFDGEKLMLERRINIGVAVDMNFEGLTVPVLKDVPNKSLSQLAREVNDLAVRARAGKLKPDELTEGTYTVTNNGAFGTVITAPIINAPQVAILSTDGVRKKPVVVEAPEGDSIAIRPIGVLAQSFDHRALDGAYAAAFLRELKLIVETRHWAQDLQS